MSAFSGIAVKGYAALLAVRGEPITYVPAALPAGGVAGEDALIPGAGTPIQTKAILYPPGIALTQSSQPSYFADIDVDPTVITSPLRGDLVTWADGTNYVVAKVVRPDAYSMVRLALHKKADPVFPT